MKIATFKDMYIAELQELVSAEEQLMESLLRLASVASHPELKESLMRRREETQVQAERLKEILRKHGADPKAHNDQAMQVLVKETEKMLTILKGNELRDAGLIASLLKMKHYEIAAYGTAAAFAGQLNLREDQLMLHRSLDEERQTDALLSHLAKRAVNPKALAS